jgi:hypothetical protein
MTTTPPYRHRSVRARSISRLQSTAAGFSFDSSRLNTAIGAGIAQVQRIRLPQRASPTNAQLRRGDGVVRHRRTQRRHNTASGRDNSMNFRHRAGLAPYDGRPRESRQPVRQTVPGDEVLVIPCTAGHSARPTNHNETAGPAKQSRDALRPARGYVSVRAHLHAGVEQLRE